MGVGKYTPNAAVNGDMGWKPPIIRQWKAVMGHYFRCVNMDNTRLNKRVFVWSYQNRKRLRNIYLDIENVLTTNGIDGTFKGNYIPKSRCKDMTNQLMTIMFDKYKNEWLTSINLTRGGRNKLRTYRTFKSAFVSEPYIKCNNLSRARKSALAKFRCGVAPLRIETGRFEGIPANERYCFHCVTCIENEEHVLMNCTLYDNIRQNMFVNILNIEPDFLSLNCSEQFCQLMSNEKFVKYTAKACNEILMHRKNCLYS